jgi:hypothetical protein
MDPPIVVYSLLQMRKLQVEISGLSPVSSEKSLGRLPGKDRNLVVPSCSKDGYSRQQHEKQ